MQIDKTITNKAIATLGRQRRIGKWKKKDNLDWIHLQRADFYLAAHTIWSHEEKSRIFQNNLDLNLPFLVVGIKKKDFQITHRSEKI